MDFSSVSKTDHCLSRFAADGNGLPQTLNRSTAITDELMYDKC